MGSNSWSEEEIEALRADLLACLRLRFPEGNAARTEVLLRSPAPGVGGTRMVLELLRDRRDFGVAYLWVLRNHLGQPVSLTVVPPYSICKITYRGSGMYRINRTGNQDRSLVASWLWVPLEDVFEFRREPPADEPVVVEGKDRA
jgi:hypothetical protein